MLRRILLIFIAVLIVLQPFACKKQPPSATQTKATRIILVNPSTWYLKSLVYLTKHKIIDLPKPEFKAVFYAKTHNRYEASEAYLKQANIRFVSLERIEGNLTKEDLFKKNELTADFYRLFKQSDGILFLGGADIPPVTYGQKTNLLTGIYTPNRHLFELSFLYHLLGRSTDSTFTPFLQEKPDYVVYGFCLGMQTMNVADGGTMIQDIPSQIYGLNYVEDILQLDPNQQHKNYRTFLSVDSLLDAHSFHQIRFVPDGFFVNRLKMGKSQQPYVCSSHHQAVGKLGPDFKVAAFSLDGKVVEAIQHKHFPNILGTQFHPEFSTLYDPNSKIYRFTFADSLRITEHTYLTKHKSYVFHVNFWQYFSKLF